MSYELTDETRLVERGGKFYRVKFFLDSDVSAPWESDCGFMPMVYLSFGYGGNSDLNDVSRGYDILDPFADATPQWVARNRHAIADAIAPVATGYNYLTGAATPLWHNAESFDSYFETEVYESEYGDKAGQRVDMFRELLDSLGNSDRLDAIAKIWKLRGVPAANLSTSGYSQGDYIETLFVAHPAWIKEMGFKSIAEYKRKCPKDAENANAMAGAYFWGGCIGYATDRLRKKDVKRLIKEHGEIRFIPESDIAELDEKEELDSCFGFFPENDSDYFPLEKNHAFALSMALESIDTHAKG